MQHKKQWGGGRREVLRSWVPNRGNACECAVLGVLGRLLAAWASCQTLPGMACRARPARPPVRVHRNGHVSADHRDETDPFRVARCRRGSRSATLKASSGTFTHSRIQMPDGLRRPLSPRMQRPVEECGTRHGAPGVARHASCFSPVRSDRESSRLSVLREPLMEHMAGAPGRPDGGGCSW